MKSCAGRLVALHYIGPVAEENKLGNRRREDGEGNKVSLLAGDSKHKSNKLSELFPTTTLVINQECVFNKKKTAIVVQTALSFSLII